MSNAVDLGWFREADMVDMRTPEEREVDLIVSALEGSAGDSRTLHYIINYRNSEKFLRDNDRILLHPLKTQWYLSEIEDVVRHSMFIHTKIVFEAPVLPIDSRC